VRTINFVGYAVRTIYALKGTHSVPYAVGFAGNARRGGLIPAYYPKKKSSRYAA
jgi:hypothetical protein